MRKLKVGDLIKDEDGYKRVCHVQKEIRNGNVITCAATTMVGISFFNYWWRRFGLPVDDSMEAAFYASCGRRAAGNGGVCQCANSKPNGFGFCATCFESLK